ncbi:secretion protein [Lonsdalea iberica]|uniref:Secretion protein n=1 Tax=Lonsdalea iberica TaxID=1082703 RepID=A0ABX3XH43_9GAMM|nr:secretion protein [Lonsdalea iberica]OSN10912.1 secretion protein [Lonsdalea iberica]
MNVNVLSSQHSHVTGTGVSSYSRINENDASQVNSSEEENPFAYGLSVLDNFELVLQKIANDLFSNLEQKSVRARNTQEKSNTMDQIIAEAAKGDDKTREKVPDDVIKYMQENGITVDGVNINDYISQHGGSEGLDKGSLQAVKAALDNSANRDTDLMTQGQIKIQKMTQEINAVITQMTGLVSKWGDLLSMIAQKMY